MKFMDDKMNNYVRQIVWSTVEYRWETGTHWSAGEKLGYSGVQARNWDTVEYRWETGI
jgi:hypothetical protein